MSEGAPIPTISAPSCRPDPSIGFDHDSLQDSPQGWG